jgi:outer membrane receptor protein involved in Fe transport
MAVGLVVAEPIAAAQTPEPAGSPPVASPPAAETPPPPPADSTPPPPVDSPPPPPVESSPSPIVETASPEGDASAYSADELADLSLGQLLDLEVSVGSRSKEKISDAPASITAWTDDDMNAFGYHTLYDLANFTAGYGTTIMYGERVLETRGQKAGSFNNNKHVVYLDGIPINHARNFKAPIDEDLPLFGASRVEFLRGPASALYGTSAFFGVINVVPRQLDKNGTAVDARMTLGSIDGELRMAGNALFTDDERSFRLSIGTYDKAASHDYVGVVDDVHNLFWDDQKSVFLNASYTLRTTALRGLSLAFLYMRKNGGLGESWNENGSSHELNDLTWESIIPYAKYERSLAEGVSVNAYLMWNIGREKGWYTNANAAQQDMYDGTGTPLGAYDTQTDDIQAQAEVNWDVAEHTRVIGGLTVDTRRQAGSSRSYGYGVNADPGMPYPKDPTLANASDDYSIYSAYVQVRQELPVLDGLIVTAGARDDFGSSSQTYNQISPRLGLVQRLPVHLSLKAFFGTALRAPGLKEIGLNQESKTTLERRGLSTDGIRALESETIRSFEAGAAYADDHVSASVTFFSNKTEHSLDGVPYMGVNIFQNSPGDVDARGTEAEVQAAASVNLRLFASYAWALAKNDDGQHLEDVPVQTANLGVIYRIMPVGITVAGALRWIDAYRATGGRDEADGSVLLDLNAGWAFAKGFRFELQARNVLDQHAKLPKHGVEDVPLPRFHVLGTLAYGF